jgi:cell division protein FtsN
VLLLACLVTLLAAVLTWGDHFLSPGPTGGIRRLVVLWADSGASEAAARAAVPAPELAVAPVPGPGEQPAAELEDPRPAREVPPPPRKVAAPPRWALELGSFALAEEAERAESLLNHAGFTTVRFRQETGSRLYLVSVALPSREEAQTAAERLRQEGLEPATVAESPHGAVVRVGTGLPLRSAVRLSERVRGAGYEPRVAAGTGRAGQITLRHGSFASRREAEQVGEQIARLGLPNEVVKIR